MNWLSIANSLIAITFRGKNRRGAADAADQASAPNGLPPQLWGSRVLYASEGRSGRVIFRKGLRSFDMYYEFGGGDVVATIDVPTRSDWPSRTGFPLELRQPILEFIGRSVVRDQTNAGRGRYVIHDDCISIHV